MEFDITKPHCYYFNEICKIPHGSENEKQLSDWIVQFAVKHKLSFVQDEMGNVVVYKAATAGYEDHPALSSRPISIWYVKKYRNPLMIF